MRGRIFATVPDERDVRIMVDEGDIRAAVSEDPEAFAEVWWGRRLSAVAADLDRADPQLVRELLTDAWRRRAPAPLARV